MRLPGIRRLFLGVSSLMCISFAARMAEYPVSSCSTCLPTREGCGHCFASIIRKPADSAARSFQYASAWATHVHSHCYGLQEENMRPTHATCRPPPPGAVPIPSGDTLDAAAQQGEPLVTFVIPTLRRFTLARTLRSIISQTDPGWRAIVVCDGCDESVHVDVGRDLHADARVLVARSAVTLGMGIDSAGLVRNVGIDMATTPWVAFVDDDDTVTEDYVRHLRDDVRRHPRVKAVVFRLLKQDGMVLPPILHQTFSRSCVGISFALNMQFLRSNGLWFVPDEAEDFDMLQRVRAIPGTEMLMSSHVAYIVREGGVPQGWVHPPIKESLFVGCSY